jgi:diadenylate cyclase
MFPNLKIGFGDVIQILVLTFAVYYVLNLFRRTRSAQMLLSLFVVIIVLIGMAYFLNLQVLGWLVSRLIVYIAFALAIIFQPEIRQTLANIGQNWRLTAGGDASDDFINGIVEVATSLSRTKTGALIAVERQISLETYCVNGTMLNAPFVTKLLASIFFPNAPLHDGGVIIRDGTILAAGCVFPLSSRDDIGHGMRHRAALGLSEQTDAVVVVVSEETGDISIAFDGEFHKELTPTHLKRFLNVLLPQNGLASAVRKAVNQIEMERVPDGGANPTAGEAAQ